MLISSEPKRAPRGVFGHPNFPYLFDDEPDEVARFRKPDRIIDLDLREDGNADQLPAITVTCQGLHFEGSTAEFDRLLLIMGGWLKP